MEAALRLVDAEGVDAVTMRRVAEELQTGPASLYAHVSDKDELLAAVYDRAFADIDLAIESSRMRWQEQIKEFARRSRDVLAAHRDLAKVGLGAVPTGPNALGCMEVMIGVLEAAGLSPRLISFAGDLLAQFLNASVYESYLFRSRFEQMGTADEWSAEMLQTVEALPADRFPVIRRLAPALFDTDEGEDDRFEFGLEVLVQGLEAMLAKRSRRNNGKS